MLKRLLPAKLLPLIPSRDAAWYKRVGFWALAIFISITAIGMLMIASMFAILSIGLPDVSDLENHAPSQSTEIFDKDGKLLYTIHGEENRDVVPFEKLNKNLIDASISIEDDAFWDHNGYDLKAIAKAGIYEVFGIGTPRGGSTITQQYVKNTFLSSERSYTRKAKELILAMRVERAYSKEEIIGLYLNRIPYGNNAYGAEKAAEVYFAKDAADLSLGESAILASLVQAPSRYNPYGDNKFSHLLVEFTDEKLSKRKIESEKDLNIEEYARGLIGQHVELGNGKTVYIQGRSDLVLKRMEELGKIDADQRQDALNEIQNVEFNNYRESIAHPHFVLYIKQVLEDRYGKDVVEQGGLKVYTSLDGELQDYAEKIATEYGESNLSRFDADNLAVLTVNPSNGHILAMVGSRDYFNEEIDGNVNVVLRPRQPGSSFKPFVYAQAFYNGYAPGNVIYDIPTKIGSDRPSNYDGQWQGQMSIRKALGQSRNIPAIKAYYLADQQDAIIDLVQKMGITTLDKSHSYGYPLALGAGEVPLSEMVTAFSVFANTGKKPELTGILKVENANGDILEEWQPKEFEEVMDPQVAYLINSILSDKSVGVGPRLFINGKINAAKTGTSTKENKKEAGGSAVRPSDAWTIGYTPSVVTGVWVGNTDGTGLAYNANGYDAASPIFNAIMTKALEGLPTEPFPEPEGIKHVQISRASGKLPGPETPTSMITTDVFASFSVPTEQEHLFVRVKIDKISGKLATEFTPEDAVQEVLFQNYEPIADMLNWRNEIRAYFAGKSSTSDTGEIRVGLPPTEYDDVHTATSASNKPVASITSPSSQSEVAKGNFTVETDISAANGIEKVEYYIDDKLVYTSTTAPYTGFLRVTNFMQTGTNHLIVAKVIDALGYSSQSAIEVRIVEESENSTEED
jgi:membrane peptidoglycan carboxypeptidase